MPSVAHKLAEMLLSGIKDHGSGANPGQPTAVTSLPSPSDGKCPSVYDSGCMDSGFLSGANISSDHLVWRNSSEYDLDDPSSPSDCSKGVESKSYSRLDSGVDVGLSEQFNSQCSVNDLNAPHRSVSQCDEAPPSPQGLLGVTTLSRDSVLDANTTLDVCFQQDQDGDTQLHIAVYEGFVEVVFGILRMVPHPCFLDIRNDCRQTALHMAVLTNQPQLARLLVVCGANPSIKDIEGNTPLHYACRKGALDSVRALTDPIAVVETMHAQTKYSTTFIHERRLSLEERNYDGYTCLHLAALCDEPSVVRYLACFGADVNAKETRGGRTILHLAIDFGLKAVLRALLDDYGGIDGVDVNALTYSGLSAFQLATHGDNWVMQRLRERGASAEAFPDDSTDDSAGESTDEDDDEMVYLYRTPYAAPTASASIRPHAVNSFSRGKVPLKQPMSLIMERRIDQQTE